MEHLDEKRRSSNRRQWTALPTIDQIPVGAHVASTTAEYLLSGLCIRFECFWPQNQQQSAYSLAFQKSSSTTSFEWFHAKKICLDMED